MAIDTDFLPYLDKPSGVYRITKDKSFVNSVGVSSTIPLIVGFSKKGLFNTPVYCPDTEYFTSVFGTVDRTLERRGSWFHRTAMELLSVGPIIVLNLYNLKNEVPEDIEKVELTDDKYDLTEYQVFSAGCAYKNHDKKKKPYSNFFNTDKFWYADEEKLNGFASQGNTEALFSATNVSQNPITVLIRKSPRKDFDVYANEYYDSEDLPSFINGDDLISDYFVEVTVISGDFTDYNKLAIDPIFQRYFDHRKGLKKEHLNDFLTLRQVTVLGVYDGCMIPDFEDKTGRILDITTLVNRDTARTGLLLALNRDILDEENISGTKFDLVGHNMKNIIATSETNSEDPIVKFLSYDTVLFEQKEKEYPTTIFSDPATKLVYNGGASVDKDQIKLVIDSKNDVGDDILNFIGEDYNKLQLPITFVATGKTAKTQEFVLTNPVKEVQDNGKVTFTFPEIDTTVFGGKVYKIKTDANGGNTRMTIVSRPFEKIEAMQIPIKEGGNMNEFFVKSIKYGNEYMELGKYIVSYTEDGTSRLCKITNIVQLAADNYKVVCDAPVKINDNAVEYTRGIDDFATHYNMTSLFGFRVKERMMPNDTNQRMNEIYGVLNTTNLGAALLDKKAITFRYLVDTFNHGIEVGSKAILTSLCKERENAFAILNAPSMKEFSKNDDPIFTKIPTIGDPTPSLDVSFIPDGGNLRANPKFRYTLPSELEGAAYGAFFAPNVTVRDHGKQLSVPPAMYVAKNFVMKHINYRPWSIIAGTQRGVIGGKNVVGLEYGFDDTERGYLEKFGINPIVFEKNVGLVVTSNKTAKQTIRTSLSEINGTEVLIYIQDRMAEILRKYVWEFNTPELRLEIKSIADQELELIKIDGGIFDYVNMMNKKNNTDEAIDNLLGILDSHIEVSKGLAKAIHRTTIHKTGQIKTGLV